MEAQSLFLRRHRPRPAARPVDRVPAPQGAARGRPHPSARSRARAPATGSTGAALAAVAAADRWPGARARRAIWRERPDGDGRERRRPAEARVKPETTFRALVNLWPYMWPSDRPDLKRRVVVALLILVAAKVITVLIPYTYKWATDALVTPITYRRRDADRRRRRGAVRADHADRRLWRRPHPDERLQQPSRRAVREGRPARRAPARLQDLRPHARRFRCAITCSGGPAASPA